MKVLYITGVSKGIGKALVDIFLNEGFTVVGLGRSSNTTHKNFIFIPCDLASSADVEGVEIPVFEQAKEAVLIHNAGVIGEIKHSSKQTLTNIDDVFQVNFLSPVKLTQRFLALLKLDVCIFISSGAGKRAIPSWSSYCASKAALDMYAQTLQLECKEQGLNTHILSVSPGVIDTDMQLEIRNSKPSEFSSHANFEALKNENKLKSPALVAEQLIKLSKNRTFDEVLVRLE